MQKFLQNREVSKNGPAPGLWPRDFTPFLQPAGGGRILGSSSSEAFQSRCHSGWNLCFSVLSQGFPSPPPGISTSSRPVRTWAAQQVSRGWTSDTSPTSSAPHRSHCRLASAPVGSVVALDSHRSMNLLWTTHGRGLGCSLLMRIWRLVIWFSVMGSCVIISLYITV